MSGVRAGLIVLVCACVLIAGAWWAAGQRREARRAQEAGELHSRTLRVAGLEGDVVIRRDDRGIPHVETVAEADAWFGLGYAHATDRREQMLWLRRMARGRLAEQEGEQALAVDRLVRTLGVGYHAEQAADALPAEPRALLEAYARGVNEALAESAPDALVAAWKPSDSLALLKLIHLASGASLDMGVVFGDLVEAVGGLGARPLIPSGQGVQGIGVPFEHLAPPVTEESLARGSGRMSLALDDARSDLAESRAWLAPLALRARAWVLAPGASASQTPLLAADFHLAPTAPSLLHQSQIGTGGLEVAGVAIPGLPIYWAGRNRDVAWALTPGGVDSMQLYREQLRVRPDSGSDGAMPTSLEHQAGSHWHPVAVRAEEIAVRDANGRLRAETIEIVSTRHGPIINERIGRVGEPLAAAWTGALLGDGMQAMLGLPRASNAAALLDAMQSHHEPPLIVVYADREGAAGWKLAGWLPQYRLATGMLPVAGQQLAFDWKRSIDFDDLPGERLSPRAESSESKRSAAARWRIVADGPAVSDEHASQIPWLWRTGFEQRSVATALEKLSARGPVGLRDLASMQASLTGRVDPGVLPAMRSLLAEGPSLSAEAEEVMQILLGWNGSMAPESRGAAVYRVLMDRLVHTHLGAHVPHDLLERYLRLAWVAPEAIVEQSLIEAAATRRAGGWTDSKELTRALQEGLHRTWIRLSYRRGPNRDRWIWGALHAFSFRPFMSSAHARAPRAWRFAQMAEIPGRGGVVGIADHDPSDPFAARRATLYRMTVDLGGPDRVLTSLAPGQSGDPESRHFSDGLGPSLSGQSELLAMSRFLVSEQSVSRLVLRAEAARPKAQAPDERN